MSNGTPTSVKHCTVSSPQLTSGLGVPVASPNKTTNFASLAPPPGTMDAILRGNLDCNKYTKLYSIEDYVKVLEGTAKILRLPIVTSPPPDVLRSMYTESLSKKNMMLGCLADAEQTCQNWEGALRQALGEAEARDISQAHPAVDADEADTVRGQYITAIGRVRMKEFCLSRRSRK